ncbi:MAG: copper chaperone CopZ, partial [Gammaproteobacteria bacterium]
MKTERLEVVEMTCSGCTSDVLRALQRVNGCTARSDSLMIPGAFSTPSVESRSGAMSLITFDAKCARARSAGSPHVACNVAGAGNGTTNDPSRARRGKARRQTRVLLTGDRASSQPYEAGSAIPAAQWVPPGAPQPGP